MSDGKFMLEKKSQSDKVTIIKAGATQIGENGCYQNVKDQSTTNFNSGVMEQHFDSKEYKQKTNTQQQQNKYSAEGTDQVDNKPMTQSNNGKIQPTRKDAQDYLETLH